MTDHIASVQQAVIKEDERTRQRQEAANVVRGLAMDGVQEANSGHPGMPMGMADAAVVLWSGFLKHNPADPKWVDRDRFVLSAGHGSMLLYSLLHVSGYELGLEELKRFRQWGSLTPGHPEHGLTVGVETTTGPLGQGIANGVGLALAERWVGARFNRPGHQVVDHFTYVIASDGDLMEGISHEACALAGHLGLGKLIVLYDDNGISIDGPTSLSFTEDVLKRFAAYGWHTDRVDGHNPAAVEIAIEQARQEVEHPSIIACRTHIGYGSPNRQDTSKAHGEPLGVEELRLTKERLGLPVDQPFYLPERVVEFMRQSGKAGAERQADWKQRFDAYREAYPELAAEFEAAMKGELPAGWDAKLPSFPADKAIATRAASGAVLDAIADVIPTLLGGSADLTPSNNTLPKGKGSVTRGDFSGRYVRFGVREHGMGSVMNGMVLHGGVRPYGGTFLVFADYMRPPIRLAALMEQPVIFVFTHDSIGLGEDGPTHQPVEHLTTLRVIPNLVVFRPADAIETVAGWKVALERKHGPTALILTRQALPILGVAAGAERGGYILSDVDAPQVILIGTGSEVQLAVAAQKQLATEGIRARVVSLPSWELFDAQPSDYKESVLPSHLTARVAVEAGSTLAWSRYVGLTGRVVGLDRFGASAPYQVLYQQLGITAEAVAAAARELVG
ncbi:MAG TPA: transketolase [Acidobacteriota bacterium]|nr:transketolase [Acidobacteriota bacterium]